MKTRIFKSSKTNGFYIYGSNYKNKEDKAYMNLFFPQGSEPTSNGDYLDIDILDAKFTSYQNKIGMTIFKYTICKEENKMKGVRNDLCTSLNISEEDLPF